MHLRDGQFPPSARLAMADDIIAPFKRWRRSRNNWRRRCRSSSLPPQSPPSNSLAHHRCKAVRSRRGSLIRRLGPLSVSSPPRCGWSIVAIASGTEKGPLALLSALHHFISTAAAQDVSGELNKLGGGPALCWPPLPTANSMIASIVYWPWTADGVVVSGSRTIEVSHLS